MDCPICHKHFGGSSAGQRYNAHCKAEHLDYYRRNIRPLKDKKEINRDAYLNRKRRHPNAVEQQRTMARMRKKARQQLVTQIQRCASPVPPINADPTIDESNPFLLCTRLGVHVGITFSELLKFDVIGELTSAMTAREKAGVQAHVVQLINDILNSNSCRSVPLNVLALQYHNYRKALVAQEDFPILQEKYQTQLEDVRRRREMPDTFITENKVQERAEELYVAYVKKKQNDDNDGSTTERDSDVEASAPASAPSSAPASTATSPPAAPAAPGAPATPAQAPRPQTVIIIDDESTVQDPVV